MSAAAAGLRVSWEKNFLKISGDELPGGTIEINYLEAFCRSGSTHQRWDKTTIPHRTELIAADKAGQRIQLRTVVEPNVEVLHDIRADADEVEFNLTAKNLGAEFADVQWFQPCMRVDRFTGGNQSNYVGRCFIFTERGLTTLDRVRRTEEAIYRGGQVYVSRGVSTNDVNPRPLSPEQPANAIIGCFSADGKHLLANAWDTPQELFQGVIVCIHNDPRIGGLKGGETKRLRGKIYFLKNDPQSLLQRYQHDFPAHREPPSRRPGGS